MKLTTLPPALGATYRARPAEDVPDGGGGAPFATVTVELTSAFVPSVAVATALSIWLPSESVLVSSCIPSPL